MQNDIFCILDCVRELLIRPVPTEDSYIYMNGTNIYTYRQFGLRQEDIIPVDLKRALQKGQIEAKHLPTRFKYEYVEFVCYYNKVELTCWVNLDERDRKRFQYSFVFKSSCILS